MTDTPELLPVEQCDREAVATFQRDYEICHNQWEQDELAKAFARHRIEALSSTQSTSSHCGGELIALLKRYRNETPLGHQPHMIAGQVDEALARFEASPAPSVRDDALEEAARLKLARKITKPYFLIDAVAPRHEAEAVDEGLRDNRPLMQAVLDALKSQSAQEKG